MDLRLWEPRWWELDAGKLPGALGTLGKKELHLWVGAWLRDRFEKRLLERTQPDAGTRHLLFCVCDHHEPLHGQGTTTTSARVDGDAMAKARARVARWHAEYPKLGAFRDSTGRPPRHTFFYPGEQYYPDLVEPIAELCATGFGEVEVHLHHDNDTREGLRDSLGQTLSDFEQHGLIPRVDGKRAWAFIHGNWCLANARRDRRYCGVDDEMQLLFDMGCYADFTFPAAPDESQPGVVNAIYYPAGDVTKRRAYEHAEKVRVGTKKRDRLLMIEGPLALAMRPHAHQVRIESAGIDASDPPNWKRLRTWAEQNITVGGRPEWVFVKVHTHGAPERNADVMLGGRTVELHEELAKKYNDGRAWNLHYVSAREMYNVARAAMDGKSGRPEAFFDYEVPPAPRVSANAPK